MKRAVILLSGGLDSTTLLYYAKDKGFKPYGLIFDYGQRHSKEIQLAKKIASHAGIDSEIVKIRMPWMGSSLLDKTQALPIRKKVDPKKIPSTYVPARNIIFLSFALSCAEAIKAQYVFIGANAVDYSGYPDCRPEFFKAYQNAVRLGSKTGVEGHQIKIETPLVHKSKAQIIRLGFKLNVPYELTWSCYQGDSKPCGICESCRLRQKGFDDAKKSDPLLGVSKV